MIGFPPESDHNTPYAFAYFSGFKGKPQREPMRAWADGVEARERYLEIRAIKSGDPHERRTHRVRHA